MRTVCLCHVCSVSLSTAVSVYVTCSVSVNSLLLLLFYYHDNDDDDDDDYMKTCVHNDKQSTIPSFRADLLRSSRMRL